MWWRRCHRSSSCWVCGPKSPSVAAPTTAWMVAAALPCEPVASVPQDAAADGACCATPELLGFAGAAAGGDGGAVAGGDGEGVGPDDGAAAGAGDAAAGACGAGIPRPAGSAPAGGASTPRAANPVAVSRTVVVAGASAR